jgi:DNA-binding protein H-NS
MNLEEMKAQRDALDQKINAQLEKEKSAALQTIRSLVEKFDFSFEELAPKKPRRGVAPGTKLAQKYKNPETGQTWSGRGKPPSWIAGQDRGRFEVSGS